MEPLAPAVPRLDADESISHPHQAVSAEELAHSFVEADEQPVDLSDASFEEWLTLALFWIMGGLVFTQFFTRYALNDSYAGTEELATNCLIAVVFIGAAACIRKDRHIQVDILYRFLPAAPARVWALRRNSYLVSGARLRAVMYPAIS